MLALAGVFRQRSCLNPTPSLPIWARFVFSPQLIALKRILPPQQENFIVATYKTNDFRKGLKVQIDGDPYQMIEMNFVKPGKGNALYKCKLRNLLRGTVLDRTYKGGDELEAADVEDIDVQYLYKQGDTFVFMHNETFEQYELTSEQVGDSWQYLKDGMKCSMVLFNENPITFEPPNHVELEVTQCEPGAKGDTATNVTKPATVETGAEIIVPGFIKQGNVIKVDTRTGDYIERVNN
jgi:elongation factor P